MPSGLHKDSAVFISFYHPTDQYDNIFWQNIPLLIKEVAG
jgi:hypothetical protein